MNTAVSWLWSLLEDCGRRGIVGTFCSAVVSLCMYLNPTRVKAICPSPLNLVACSVNLRLFQMPDTCSGKQNIINWGSYTVDHWMLVESPKFRQNQNIIIILDTIQWFDYIIGQLFIAKSSMWQIWDYKRQNNVRDHKNNHDSEYYWVSMSLWVLLIIHKNVT